MILKLIEQFFDISAFKEELRKIGTALVTGDIAGIFLEHLVSIALAAWLVVIGVLFILSGLLKTKRRGCYEFGGNLYNELYYFSFWIYERCSNTC